MQKLTRRLRTTDPEAAEELRVVSYFDALVAEYATVEALLRGAASLAGVPAGFQTPRTSMRVDGDGIRSTPPAGSAERWSAVELSVPGRVWLERDGEAPPIDRMIATRLAMALSLTLTRGGRNRTPLEVLIDLETSPTEKVEAAGRLRLTSASSGRMIATPVGVITHPGAVVVATPAGFVAAAYVPDGIPLSAEGIVGIGVPAVGLALAASWQSAVLAFRLSDGGSVAAEELGVLVPLLLAAERDSADHPDVRKLARLARADPGMLATAKALATERSIRAASTLLGLHPSTVHARTVALSESLGFDPLGADGRLRLALAVRLHKLAETRLTPDV